MAHNDRNYVSSDFAAKLERARKRVQRTPMVPRPNMPSLPAPPQVTSVFRVYNDEPEPIPQFAVMEVEGLDEQQGYSATREAYAVVQASTSGYLYMVNAGDEIQYTHFGGGVFATEPTKILIDPTASPSFGDRFGAASGHWYVTPNIAGTLMYLGQNDGETGIFLDVERAIDSLVIGVTIASTADTFATITSRPPGWPEVPGEAASVVQITNPSSISIGSTSFKCHAVYNRRNDTDTWEIIGGRVSGGQEPAYGSMIHGTTFFAGTGAYQQAPLRTPTVTAYGMTASTANFNFVIATEGDYEAQYWVDQISLDSGGSTEFTATFGLFRNSTAVSAWNQHVSVQNSSGKTFYQRAGASGIAHFYVNDAVDLRVLFANVDTIVMSAGMSMHLIRATTST